jgi:thymidylate synthase
MENHLDRDYQNLMSRIIRDGISKEDRTGTGTVSLFGTEIRHDMRTGFPLLTTKKMAWKSIVVELLWFLQGRTDLRYLLENDCHIWTGDAYKVYDKDFDAEYPPFSAPYPPRLTMQEFEQKIMEDDVFNKMYGDLGPIYGAQWRSWRVGKGIETTLKTEDGQTLYEAGSMYIDQIANLINDLKTNPDSRRLMVSSWNVGELDQMTLPPCHYGFQMYTIEMTENDRMIRWCESLGKDISYASNIKNINDHLDKLGFAKRKISLMWNQRSADYLLGVPFNIASYGLLLMIIAKEVNMIPDQLIGRFGDTHLYSNHHSQASKQIPREPFKLPTLKIEDEVKWKEYDCLPSYSVTDFTLENYQSHPAIKAPLSN